MEIANTRQHVRKKQIRSIVRSLHEELKSAGEFRVPIPVDKVAKLLDVKVMYVETEDEDLSGFFYRDPSSGKAVIGVNDDHYRTRQRFTLAHEIGHLVLHSFDDLHYDRKGYGTGYGRIRKRDGESALGENRDEIEANYFAAELLMPEELIYEKIENADLGDIFERSAESAVKALAKEFDVSPLALTIRMQQLGMLNTA